jgi:lysozyme family protein
MASFEVAITRILKTEGGYVIDPSDPGGETYRGVARHYHPRWVGWKRVDEYKRAEGFPGVLDGDRVLDQYVRDFYKDWYWDAVGLDGVESQEIAEEILDMAVHLGVKRAVMFLQRGLNVLNRQGRMWPDLVVDSLSGPRTRTALSKYEAMEAPNFLIKILILQRGGYYVERVLEREESEKYIRGWLRRLQLR